MMKEDMYSQQTRRRIYNNIVQIDQTVSDNKGEPVILDDKYMK